MTTKICGNCKWWSTYPYDILDGLNFSHGLCTHQSMWIDYKHNNEGQDCPVFEERKE